MALQLPGAGPHRFWGFSPTYDVRNPACRAEAPAALAGAAHTSLLICPADARHVLQTLANARLGSSATPGAELTFHVYEEHPEQLARHMLQLSIALDFELPRRERAEIYLEVMGNTMLRERTALYLAAHARALRALLAREEGELACRIDTSFLKMKQRDALEDVLATWADGVEFDVERLRDERLRAFYGDRYDHRRNVLDWDYAMGLALTAPGIHRIHFREWRLSGLAYEVRDAAYCAPNRSLASAAAGRQRGASVLKRGFWGDVVNTPYAAVGVECDDARFFAKRQDQVVKTSQDVAYYNVVGWFTQLETGHAFAVRAEDFADFEYGASVGRGGLVKGFLRTDQTGPRPREQAAGVGIDEEAEDGADGAEVGAAGADGPDAAAAAADPAAAAAAVVAAKAQVLRELARRRMGLLPAFKLVLHTGSALELFTTAGRAARALKSACAHVHVASHAAHLLALPLGAALADEAVVAVEGARFLVEVHKDAKQRLASKLVELGARAGLESVKAAEQLDGQHEALVVFRFERAREEARKADAQERYGRSIVASSGAPAADGEVEGAAASVLADALAAGASLDEAAPSADVDDVAGGLTIAVAAAREPAATRAPEPAVPDAIGTSGARVCAVTGLPAKYKDPKTGCYYAHADAFKELRRRHAAANGEAEAPQLQAATEPAEVAGGAPSPQPAPSHDDETSTIIRPTGPSIVTGGTTRRLNKVV